MPRSTLRPYGNTPFALKIPGIPTSINANTKANITIAGAGNAAHVLCGILGQNPNFSVTLWTKLQSECEKLNGLLKKNNHEMEVVFADGRPSIKGKIKETVCEGDEILKDTDLLVLAVPAPFHEIYLKEIHKYLHDMHVVCMVAEGGFDWATLSALAMGEDGDTLSANVSVFAMETLPWACRIKEFGYCAEVLGTKDEIDSCAFPLKETPTLSKMYEQLFSLPRTNKDETLAPKIHPLKSFLALTLMNINSVWHPCVLYGKFGEEKWDQKSSFKEVPLFYESIDKYTTDVLNNVSTEVLTIKKKVKELAKDKITLEGVQHVLDWIKRAYHTDIVDFTDLQTCIVSNRAYKGIKHTMVTAPSGDGYLPDKKARYFKEDIAYGLLVTRGIGEILGVPTPQMDKIIMWSQKFTDKEYLVNGKVGGRDILETRAPQRFGINTVQDFLKMSFME